MATSLKGKRIAVLATDGFEEVELTRPVKALRDAGADVTVIAPRAGAIQGMNHDQKGDSVSVDETLAAADPDHFSALMLPGGVTNPDTLRVNPEAIGFIRHFVTSRKPIGAICHGPWTLIEAEAVRGRTMTSWPSLRTDLKNAGANWVDEAVVQDGSLVTSRKPGDLDAFCARLIDVFGQTESLHAT